MLTQGQRNFTVIIWEEGESGGHGVTIVRRASWRGVGQLEVAGSREGTETKQMGWGITESPSVRSEEREGQRKREPAL